MGRHTQAILDKYAQSANPQGTYEVGLLMEGCAADRGPQRTDQPRPTTARSTASRDREQSLPPAIHSAWIPGYMLGRLMGTQPRPQGLDCMPGGGTRE